MRARRWGLGRRTEVFLQPLPARPCLSTPLPCASLCTSGLSGEGGEASGEPV